MEQRRILVVDDEPQIAEALQAYLEHCGYAVTVADTGKKALAAAAAQNIALVLLDLMLPDLPGEEVCAALRRTSRVPVMMLTAKTAPQEELAGLQLGADDYITKPFSLKLVAARVEAVLRRSAGDLAPLALRNAWRGGDFTVDFEQDVFTKAGRPLRLTPNEKRLLAALVKVPGKVLTRAELINLAFDEDFDSYDRVVDTHIKNLRQKIEDDPRHPVYLLTVHGRGYRFGGE